MNGCASSPERLRSVLRGACRMPDMPLLSVTILNYNYGRFLRQCLDSILRQDFTDFEIILIDDTSTDDSLEVAAPYLADPRIRLVAHATNQGFGASLVEGCTLSRGKYITLVSADDWIESSQAFSAQIAVMERDPAVAFAFSAYQEWDSPQRQPHVWRAATADFVKRRPRPVRRPPARPSSDAQWHAHPQERLYSHPAAMTRASKSRPDTRMWLGLCSVGKGAYIDQILYTWRRHGSNMSGGRAESLRIMIGEVLGAIEWSYKLWPADIRQSLRRAKADGVRHALTAHARRRDFQRALSLRLAQRGYRGAASASADTWTEDDPGFDIANTIGRTRFSICTSARRANYGRSTRLRDINLLLG